METFMRDVLGLQAESSNAAEGAADGDETGRFLVIVDMRTKAKANKDWGTADQIRDVLADHGITIQDGKMAAPGPVGKATRRFVSPSVSLWMSCDTNSPKPPAQATTPVEIRGP